MYERIIRDLHQKMDQVLEKLKEDFRGLRTGKADASLVENVQVNYYGSKVPLKQMANISTPEANLIVIQPWDANSLGDIELGIRNAELGLTPSNDGRKICLSLPAMTSERREELIKIVHQLAEEGRIILRNLREESWKEIKKLETQKQITEDDRYDAEKKLNQDIADFNLKINQIIGDKEKEMRTI